MTRNAAIKALTAVLEEQLASATRAAKDAASYATDEESRAESKWDTQGLEASYLAAGQAHQVEEISSTIGMFSTLATQRFTKSSPVDIGAMVKLEADGFTDWFLVAKTGGGTSAEVKAEEITVITPQSPLGGILMGLRQGDKLAYPNGTSASITKVV